MSASAATGRRGSERRPPGPPPILVTGASGNVGSAVVRHLRDRGVAVRAADVHRSDRPAGPGPAVHLDFRDPATFGPALAGVRRVFLIRPPAIARVQPTINRFIDEAAAVGVEFVVFSSVAGAERNRFVPHHRIEQQLRRRGLAVTLLRPGFFAQNLATAYADDLRADDRLYLPAGAGRVAFVDTRDVGEVAASILARPEGHAGQAYTLTGPRAVDLAEVAAMLTAALGRPIRYEPASIVGYLDHLRRRELPLAQRLVQTVLHVGLRRGDAEEVDPTLGALLGRPPRDLADYLADHLHRWAPSGRPGQVVRPWSGGS